MDEIIIRSATLADMESLLAFEQGVIGAERPFDSTIKDGHVHYYDLNEMINADHIELLVAEINGRPIGSGYARIKESQQFYKNAYFAYLGFMYVLPEYRGKGVNGLLIEGLKKWVLSKGLTELRLQVYEDNLPAIIAYEKVGFSKHLVEMRLGLEDDKI